MELFIFGRFHARAGSEAELAAEIGAVLPPTRREEGCIAIDAFRSLRDPRLFYVHSRWRDEAAFDAHAEAPHTRRFIAGVETLIDHALDVTRATKLG